MDSVYLQLLCFSADPSIGDVLCHDRGATSVRMPALGNSIPNCTKFGPYIPSMVGVLTSNHEFFHTFFKKGVKMYDQSESKNLVLQLAFILLTNRIIPNSIHVNELH